MDLSEEDVAEYEQKLEDTDLKAVLIDIASTNRQILNQLYLLNQTLDEPRSESEMYECDMCSEIVQEDERKRHMKKEHNAPPSIDVADMFE